MEANKMTFLDCHIHYAMPLNPKDLIDVMEYTNTDAANLVIVPHRERVSSVPDALMVKHMYPGKFYVFSSLDVTKYFMSNKTVGKKFVKHIKNMIACGCDGVKMIEGKPELRRTIPIPDFDKSVWEPFWQYAEESEIPILWHVNDPEEFWDPDKIPAWAKSQGWLYGKETINNEVQYLQVLNVLERHPKLRIIFAHFFFMSAQLERLASILNQFPNIAIDLTPGIEMYINMSSNQEAAKNFFHQYQDRILYGTDIGARSVLGVGGKQISLEESRNRSMLVRSFLMDSTDVIVKADGNFLIGTEDFTLKGLSLPDSILTKIFSENFFNMVGRNPRLVSPRKVIAECRHIKLLIKIMSLIDKKVKPDYSCANQVIKYFKSKG